MGIAVRIWRVLLWIFGGLFVLPSAALLWFALRDSDGSLAVLSIQLFGLDFLAAALALVAAGGMKRRWGRGVSWIAASVQILAIPVFTPLGIFGVVLLALGA